MKKINICWKNRTYNKLKSVQYANDKRKKLKISPGPDISFILDLRNMNLTEKNAAPLSLHQPQFLEENQVIFAPFIDRNKNFTR